MIDNELEELLEETPFITPEQFSLEIVEMAANKGFDISEAILEFASKNDMEIDEVAKLITQPLKEKLEVEFTEKRYFKKTFVSLEGF
jgi:uncharacterized protein YdhG (YjbR/CyaY superfamily)